MEKKLIIGLLLLMVLMPNVVGVGLSPPQLRVKEAPMGANTYVATLSTVNTGDEPEYMILKISCLAKTREHKLRVICKDCNREVGIQRGDLLHPSRIKSIINETIITKENIQANISSFPDASIGDYILIKDGFVQRIIPIEKKDDSFCPFCNSDDLIYYDFPPDNVLEHGINLVCKNHPLEQIDNRTYKTIEKIQPHDAAEIEIHLDIPYKKEYCNKHWEARIMAISVTDMDRLNEFIVYGIEAKFLIDTQVLMEESAAEKENPVFMLLVLGSMGIFVIVISVFFFKSRNKSVLIIFPEREKTLKTIGKGRRL